MIIKEEVIWRYLNDKGVYNISDVKVSRIRENSISYDYVKNNDQYFGSISKKIYLKYYRKYKLEEFLNYV